MCGGGNRHNSLIRNVTTYLVIGAFEFIRVKVFLIDLMSMCYERLLYAYALARFKLFCLIIVNSV